MTRVLPTALPATLYTTDTRRLREQAVAPIEALSERFPGREARPVPRLPVEHLATGELIRQPIPDFVGYGRLRVASTFEVAPSSPLPDSPALYPASEHHAAGVYRRHNGTDLAPSDKTGLIVDAYA